MTYGLNPDLFVEQGSAIQADRAARMRSTRAFQAWHTLDHEQRLALIDRALQPAMNDNLGNGFPVAL